MAGASAGSRSRRLAVIALVSYLAIVAFGVFGPDPVDPIETAGDGARKVAGEIRSAIPGSPAAESPGGPADHRLLGGLRDEDIANIAMFVPLGLLFPLVFPRWRWWTVIAGVAASATIEGIQLVFLTWRSPSLSDIALNGLGGAVGFALWLAARGVGRALHQRETSPSTP